MRSDEPESGKKEESPAEKGVPATKACPSCGAEMTAASEYCPRCGRKPRFEEEKPEKPPMNIKKSLLYLGRDVGIAVIIVLVILGTIFAYTRVWPPMVVIESESMQHGNSATHIGVIDTGDLVLVQAATQRSDITTWIEGKATGYMTYGNYGDVIIYKVGEQSTPIIHRPMFYMVWNSVSERFDIPDLEKLPRGFWRATYFNGTVVTKPVGMDGTLWLYQSGWDWNLTTRFDIRGFLSFERNGYVTMGDNNAYAHLTPGDPIGQNYDHNYFPSQEDIVGKARGELPWFGLIKLTLSPGETGCCRGWGDQYVPKNSWDSLLLSLALIIASPIIIDISGSLLKKKGRHSEEGSTEKDDSGDLEPSAQKNPKGNGTPPQELEEDSGDPPDAPDNI